LFRGLFGRSVLFIVDKISFWRISRMSRASP
jgi:hypothetical protein